MRRALGGLRGGKGARLAYSYGNRMVEYWHLELEAGCKIWVVPKGGGGHHGREGATGRGTFEKTLREGTILCHNQESVLGYGGGGAGAGRGSGEGVSATGEEVGGRQGPSPAKEGDDPGRQPGDRMLGVVGA